MKAPLDRIGSFIDKKERVLFPILLLLAILLLVINVTTSPYEKAGPDGLKYERFGYETSISRHLLGCGNFTHAYWSPGWVLTIAAVYRVFGPQYTAIRILLVIIAIGTALLIHHVADHIAGKRAAIIAPVFFLFSTLVFRYTVFYQYELLLCFMTFLCGTILFAHNSRMSIKNESIVNLHCLMVLRILLGGALIGLAALISPRVLVSVLVFGACFYLRGKTSYLVKALPIFSAGILLILGPWTVRNYRCFGELIFTTTNGGINLYIGNNAHSTGGYYLPPEELRPDFKKYETKKWYGEALRYIYSHPWQTIGRSLKKGLIFWNPHYGDQIIVLLAFLAGLIRMKRRRLQILSPNIFWVLALPFMFTIVHMIFFVQPRYSLPVLPSIAVIAGIGIGGVSPAKSPRNRS